MYIHMYTHTYYYMRFESQQKDHYRLVGEVTLGPKFPFFSAHVTLAFFFGGASLASGTASAQDHVSHYLNRKVCALMVF